MDREIFRHTIVERVYDVRKKLGLSQEEFGRAIGVSRSAVCNYENGTRPVGEQVIRAICREFNVNGVWLRDGVGEWRKSKGDDILAKLIAEFKCSNFEGEFLRTYFQMDREERDQFVKCMYRLIVPFMEKMGGKNPLAEYYDLDPETEIIYAKSQSKKLQDRINALDSILSASKEEDGVADAEAAYEKSLGFVPSTGLSASNTTGGAASPSGKPKEETTTENGGGESGNDVG